jgi:hypothetical protein
MKYMMKYIRIGVVKIAVVSLIITASLFVLFLNHPLEQGETSSIQMKMPLFTLEATRRLGK